MRVQPSQEEFDAMNDPKFMDWWDETMAQVQAEATSEDEVQACQDAMDAAWAARWNEEA
jgi:hypothetical protein